MCIIGGILISLTILALLLIVLGWLFCVVDDCMLGGLLSDTIKKKVERWLEDKENNEEKH